MSLSCDFDFIYVQEIHGIYVMLIKAGCSWIFFCAMLTLCETIKFYCTNLKLAKETNFNILQVGERNYSCNIRYTFSDNNLCLYYAYRLWKGW